MNTTHYSLSADSRRWWWPSAAAAAAASAAIAALVAVPAGAIPDHDPGLGTGADIGADIGTGTGVTAVPGGTDVGRTATTAVFGNGGEGRPCFLVRAQWNNALDAQQPVCGLGAPREKESKGVAGTRLRVADCPPPPDVRYVGLPWVPSKPTGCTSLDRWWTVVPAG